MMRQRLVTIKPTTAFFLRGLRQLLPELCESLWKSCNLRSATDQEAYDWLMSNNNHGRILGVVIGAAMAGVGMLLGFWGEPFGLWSFGIGGLAQIAGSIWLSDKALERLSIFLPLLGLIFS